MVRPIGPALASDAGPAATVGPTPDCGAPAFVIGVGLIAAAIGAFGFVIGAGLSAGANAVLAKEAGPYFSSVIPDSVSDEHDPSAAVSDSSKRRSPEPWRRTRSTAILSK